MRTGVHDFEVFRLMVLLVTGVHDFEVFRLMVLLVTDVSVKPAVTIFRVTVVCGY